MIGERRPTSSAEEKRSRTPLPRHAAVFCGGALFGGAVALHAVTGTSGPASESQLLHQEAPDLGQTPDVRRHSRFAFGGSLADTCKCSESPASTLERRAPERMLHWLTTAYGSNDSLEIDCRSDPCVVLAHRDRERGGAEWLAAYERLSEEYGDRLVNTRYVHGGTIPPVEVDVFAIAEDSEQGARRARARVRERLSEFADDLEPRDGEMGDECVSYIDCRPSLTCAGATGFEGCGASLCCAPRCDPRIEGSCSEFGTELECIGDARKHMFPDTLSVRLDFGYCSRPS